MAGFSEDHQAFIEVLDGVPVGLAFYDSGGSLVHQNRTLRRILEDTETESVEREIASAVREACSHLDDEIISHSRRHGILGDFPLREVWCADRRYRLRVGITDMELFGPGSSVIVTLDRERTTTDLSDEELVAHAGLTKREVKVARLLADGLTNAEIADRLFISPHTVRRHTEKILKKLKVPTRTQVSSALMRLSMRRQPKTNRPSGSLQN
jgi:DNA-binding CsgD family transcriptional regulator